VKFAGESRNGKSDAKETNNAFSSSQW